MSFHVSLLDNQLVHFQTSLRAQPQSSVENYLSSLTQELNPILALPGSLIIVCVAGKLAVVRECYLGYKFVVWQLYYC